MNEGVRSVDMVARIGGEEFLVILPQIRSEEALKLADRLRISIAEYNFKDVDKLTVSMGVSEKGPEDTFDTLLKRADKGLYISKNNGRNRATLV